MDDIYTYYHTYIRSIYIIRSMWIRIHIFAQESQQQCWHIYFGKDWHDQHSHTPSKQWQRVRNHIIHRVIRQSHDTQVHRLYIYTNFIIRPKHTSYIWYHMICSLSYCCWTCVQDPYDKLRQQWTGLRIKRDRRFVYDTYVYVCMICTYSL